MSNPYNGQEDLLGERTEYFLDQHEPRKMIVNRVLYYFTYPKRILDSKDLLFIGSPDKNFGWKKISREEYMAHIL